MSLRTKTIHLIIGTMLVLSVAISVAARSFLFKPFEDLEKNLVEKNLAAAGNLIRGELNTLGSTSEDWAYWDATYKFMADRNPGYIQSNLTNESL